jgi:type IV pilus assembly protein PilO
MATVASTAAGLSLSRLPLPAKVLLGITIILLVGLCYWVIFFTEVSAKIDNETKRSGDLQSDLARQQQAQASYLVDRDELVMRQQRQRELNKILPADTEVAAFLSALQQVSNVSGIDLKAWQPQDEQAQAFFAKVPMKLELSGRFHQIAKFIYEVGKLDRIINVENVALSDPKVVGDEVVLKAQCLATTFHTLKPKAAPPGGAPGQAGQSGQAGQPGQPGATPAQPGGKP